MLARITPSNPYLGIVNLARCKYGGRIFASIIKRVDQGISSNDDDALNKFIEELKYLIETGEIENSLRENITAQKDAMLMAYEKITWALNLRYLKSSSQEDKEEFDKYLAGWKALLEENKSKPQYFQKSLF